MMNPDAQALRRKDTTKGPPLRILCLDGGGVRGYSMLLILQEVMHRTHVEVHGRAPRPNEIPKPCDHFDLIAGTGTGGLIAIMLGRLRLDLETCKEVYIRMTRRVFETDKTFAGIPIRSTLFKASKLEEAIRDCVREHTIFEDEGNDTLATATPMTPNAAAFRPSSIGRSLSNASSGPFSPTSSRARDSFMGTSVRGWGNPNALLYDVRENRTKTAVTAVYKGTQHGGGSILLRSYDSRREPAPEVNCTIWQAGRATSATALAFKPIQIGQSVFLDEGEAKYNPSPQILDEAVLNEWPTREVGVFMTIGTGKRPANAGRRQPEWWEGLVGGSMGEFAEAHRRLVSKIEGCEDTHQMMLREHLARRGVNQEHYYRLNVEVGVGEFGMNEWSRLADISTNTRRYLARSDVQAMNSSAAAKIARIHRAKMRWERAMDGENLSTDRPYSFEEARSDVGVGEDGVQVSEMGEPKTPVVAELPAELPAPPMPGHSHTSSLPYRPVPAAPPPPPPPPPKQDEQQQHGQAHGSGGNNNFYSSQSHPSGAGATAATAAQSALEPSRFSQTMATSDEFPTAIVPDEDGEGMNPSQNDYPYPSYPANYPSYPPTQPHPHPHLHTSLQPPSESQYYHRPPPSDSYSQPQLQSQAPSHLQSQQHPQNQNQNQNHGQTQTQAQYQTYPPQYNQFSYNNNPASSPPPPLPPKTPVGGHRIPSAGGGGAAAAATASGGATGGEASAHSGVSGQTTTTKTQYVHRSPPPPPPQQQQQQSQGEHQTVRPRPPYPDPDGPPPVVSLRDKPTYGIKHLSAGKQQQFQ